MFKYLITGSLFFWSLLYGIMLSEDLAIYVPGTDPKRSGQACIYLDAHFKSRIYFTRSSGNSLSINGCPVFQKTK